VSRSWLRRPLILKHFSYFTQLFLSASDLPAQLAFGKLISVFVFVRFYVENSLVKHFKHILNMDFKEVCCNRDIPSRHDGADKVLPILKRNNRRISIPNARMFVLIDF